MGHLLISEALIYEQEKNKMNQLLPAPVLIVEDDKMVLQRLKNILLDFGYDEESLVFCGSLARARHSFAQHPVALALVDLGLPDGNGIELITEMAQEDPGLPIVVISAWATPDMIFNSLRAGATGYLLKERDDIEITLALRSVLRGGAPIDPFVAKRIVAELPPPPKVADTPDVPPETLTARETEILNLVAAGLTNRAIAEKLFISRYTVECHIKRIYRKLAVSSRTLAINMARRHGLLE